MDWITSNNVNSLGLVLDIIGVVLLFMFGLPPNVDRGGITHIITEQIDESEKRKAELYDRWSWAALCALVGGFLLQIASNYIGPV